MSSILTVVPVLDTNAYAAGDIIAATTAINGVGGAGGQARRLKSVSILDKADQAACAMNLILLRSNVSIGTINSAPSISDANADYIEGIIPINASDWVDLGGSKRVDKTSTDVGLPLGVRGDSSNKAYFAIVAVGTPGTYAADSFTVTFEFED